MSIRDRDDVARAAAALLRDGRAESLGEAVRIAAERAGLPPQTVGVADVRGHVRAMALEMLGDVGYRRLVADVLAKAEEAMTLFSTLPEDPQIVLVGRAARGEVDADPVGRIRVWTDTSISDLAELMVAAGYAEPSFATIETQWGRLAQLVVDDDGLELRVTRCPLGARVPMDADLTTGRRVPQLSLIAIRRMIEELRSFPES